MNKFINIKTRVSSFFSNDENLILIDEKNRVLYFDNSFKFLKGFKLKIPQNDPDENGVKFSYDGNYLLVALNKTLTLFSLKQKKHMASFLSKYDILSVGFSKDNKYFALGNLNGEIFVYSLKHRKKVYELRRHKDFISDITFYEDKSHLVAGSFDKCVIFYNLITLDKKDRYYHIKPVKKVEKKEFLISLDEISTLVNWDEYKKDYRDISNLYKKFSDFIIFKDYAIVATSKNLVVYNIKEAFVENDNFLEVEDIDKVAIFKNYLVFSLKNGEIYYKNLFEDEKEFLDLIIKEEYKKVFELLNKNPFLKYSRGYERLNRIIELNIKRAKELFLVDEARAIEILEKFLLIPTLRSKVQKIIEEFRNYKKFVFAIKQKNYNLAYLLANRYPSLKESKYYKLLEKKWEITFEKAKQYALNNQIEKAKEILKDFLGVPEKLPLINLLLKEAEVFKLLREKLAKRDFKGFFALIKSHPELKDTKEYTKVINYANNLYELANKALLKENLKIAKRAALILQDIEGFEDKAKEILEKVEIILKFLYFVNQKKYEEAIEFSELYSFLKQLPTYKKLIQKHNEVYEKVESLISEGKHQEAKELMEKENVISNRIKI